MVISYCSSMMQLLEFYS